MVFLYYFILTTTSTTFRGKEGKGERREAIRAARSASLVGAAERLLVRV